VCIADGWELARQCREFMEMRGEHTWAFNIRYNVLGYRTGQTETVKC